VICDVKRVQLSCQLLLCTVAGFRTATNKKKKKTPHPPTQAPTTRYFLVRSPLCLLLSISIQYEPSVISSFFTKTMRYDDDDDDVGACRKILMRCFTNNKMTRKSLTQRHNARFKRHNFLKVVTCALFQVFHSKHVQVFSCRYHRGPMFASRTAKKVSNQNFNQVSVVFAMLAE
jgi:hypothetical protein